MAEELEERTVKFLIDNGDLLTEVRHSFWSVFLESSSFKVQSAYQISYAYSAALMLPHIFVKCDTQ